MPNSLTQSYIGQVSLNFVGDDTNFYTLGWTRGTGASNYHMMRIKIDTLHVGFAAELRRMYMDQQVMQNSKSARKPTDHRLKIEWDEANVKDRVVAHCKIAIVPVSIQFLGQRSYRRPSIRQYNSTKPIPNGGPFQVVNVERERPPAAWPVQTLAKHHKKYSSSMLR